MAANVQTMAYYGEVPWHELGIVVPQGVSAKEMIQAAGMDWRVDLRPARGAKEINSKGEYSRYELVREARPNLEEEDVLLGLVGRRYQPLQNVDAFEFFDPIVGEKKAFFETAGVLGEGERIWVMARMPEAMEIVKGDDCYNYLLLSNTHTGDGSVIVKFTSVRVVCENTLMMAMEDGQKAYRVRHSKKMQFKLDELASFLAITQKVFQSAQETFQMLATVEMTQHKRRRARDRRVGSICRRSSKQRLTFNYRTSMARCGLPTMPSLALRTTSSRSRKSSQTNIWSESGLAAEQTSSLLR
jgi:phage/plasmid-like protein (TIGR03299 family)